MSESNTQPGEKNEFTFIELADFKPLDDDSGGFAGYGNNFGLLDSYDDITHSGCFSEDLKDFINSGFGVVDHRWGIERRDRHRQ